MSGSIFQKHKESQDGWNKLSKMREDQKVGQGQITKGL